MSITAISKLQDAQKMSIGAVPVKNMLKCVSQKNPISRLWQQILYFFTHGRIVNKKRLVKSLHETDIPTLRKIDNLFKKATSLAETASKSADAKEKKEADAFLKNKKNHKIFLELLQQEFLTKFAGNDAEVQAYVKTLPADQKELLISFSKKGLTAGFIAYLVQNQSATNTLEVIKKNLENLENFKNVVEEFLEGLPSCKNSDIPPIPDLLKDMEAGWYALIQNRVKVQKVSEDPIKAVTFKNANPALPDQIILAAPKPTNADETANIFKRALENSSHLIVIGYPRSFLIAKAGEEQKLGNSSITIKLLEHTCIDLESKVDDASIAYSRKFLVTDASVMENDQPLQRTIDVLIYPNWEAGSSFKLSEMKAFVKLTSKYQNPIVVGSDEQMANAGTYMVLRQTVADKHGNAPIIKNYYQVGQHLGKAALPQTIEEMASVYAYFRSNNKEEELPLLKPIKTNYTPDEFVKAVWAINYPGKEITSEQLHRLYHQLGNVKNKRANNVEKSETISPLVIEFFALLSKENIPINETLKNIISEKASIYSGGKKDQFIPDAIEEAVTEFKKLRAEKFAELAKELFKDLSAEALKAKEVQLIDTFATPDFEDFIRNPDHHVCIKKMLDHKMTVREFEFLADEYFPEYLDHISEDTKKKRPDFHKANKLDVKLLAKDQEAFSDVLKALIKARDTAKA